MTEEKRIQAGAILPVIDGYIHLVKHASGIYKERLGPVGATKDFRKILHMPQYEIESAPGHKRLFDPHLKRAALEDFCTQMYDDHDIESMLSHRAIQYAAYAGSMMDFNRKKSIEQYFFLLEPNRTNFVKNDKKISLIRPITPSIEIDMITMPTKLILMHLKTMKRMNLEKRAISLHNIRYDMIPDMYGLDKLLNRHAMHIDAKYYAK